MSRKIIRSPELQAKLNVSRTTIHRWENDPNMGFPKRVRLGANSVGYFLDEIDEFIASRPRVSGKPKTAVSME